MCYNIIGPETSQRVVAGLAKLFTMKALNILQLFQFMKEQGKKPGSPLGRCIVCSSAKDLGPFADHYDDPQGQ
jgi:hypothetical protein